VNVTPYRHSVNSPNSPLAVSIPSHLQTGPTLPNSVKQRSFWQPSIKIKNCEDISKRRVFSNFMRKIAFHRTQLGELRVNSLERTSVASRASRVIRFGSKKQFVEGYDSFGHPHGLDRRDKSKDQYDIKRGFKHPKESIISTQIKFEEIRNHKGRSFAKFKIQFLRPHNSRNGVELKYICIFKKV